MRLEKEGERDLTLDEPLLRYLSHAESPGTAEGLRRVVRAASFLSLDRRGRLWVTGPGRGAPRLVPALRERTRLLEEAMRGLAHPGGERLYAALR